jgi:outer membrane protein TolC
LRNPANDDADLRTHGLHKKLQRYRIDAENKLARERFTILTRTSNLEVTNAIFALARARDNIVDATFRLNAARVNLARALGRLDDLR